MVTMSARPDTNGSFLGVVKNKVNEKNKKQ